MAAGEKYLTYGEVVNGGVINDLTKSLGFSQETRYRLFGSGTTFLECFESDGTNAVTSATKTGGKSLGYYAINLTLRNEIVQKRSTSNAWYPAATCMKTYAEFNNANAMGAVGYPQFALVNPSTGKIKAKDFIIISGNTEISLLNIMTPQAPVVYTLYTRTISEILISNGGVYPVASNLKMVLTTDYGTVTWNFGSWAASGTEKILNNISASRSSISCTSTYPPRLSFTGTMGGKALTNYTIYVSGFSEARFNTINKGNAYTEIMVSNGHQLPFDNINPMDVDFVETEY